MSLHANPRRSALYYPYIHIRNEHWLKATLLCVPTLTRIVPDTYTPEDDPIIHKYTSLKGPGGPLLQAVAPRFSGRANAAQQQLITLLTEHKNEITRNYSRPHAPQPDEYWIHTAKFNHDLLDYLRAHDLAWLGHDPDAYGNREWFALHPILGSAVMTTLGLSIAAENHLDIVTPNHRYHEALLGTTEGDVAAALLHRPRPVDQTRSAQKRYDLAQLAITLSGVNYRAIPPEAIPELQASPHLTKFQQIIREAAPRVENKKDPEEYDRELKECATEIVDVWRNTTKEFARKLTAPLLGAAAGLGLKSYCDVSNPLALAIDAGIAVIMIGYTAITNRPGTSRYHYLTQVNRAQDDILRLTFPLGITPDLHHE
ncbi:hypothetical protein [Paludibaculum fermentans]|uniref:Uncharacterized protein n=1 Tax=Paludibaculum fermentans TaxID=1473598 RepID=A0A7S7NRD0_PALFE|nr:hypothetical protein [Paludibaculum fermentans]QOY88383.1 hypothetical protein IRI77_37605 [Paludibaculum fermentans]